MKLFGYTIIPTKDYEAICKENEKVNNLALERKAFIDHIQYGWDDIKTEEEYFIALDVWDKPNFKVVYRFKFGTEKFQIAVKRFFFDPYDEDDKDYAKRCAEELLEKLKEKI